MLEGDTVRDNILNIMKNSDKALDIYEIQNLLGVDSVEEIKELSDELRSLEEETIIYHSNKDKYMLLENSHLYQM